MSELPINSTLSDRMRLAEDMRLNYRTMEVCDLSEWCHQAMEQLRLDELEIQQLNTRTPPASPASKPSGADPAIEVGATFNRRLDAVRVDDYEKAIAALRVARHAEVDNDYIADWLTHRANELSKRRSQ